MSELPDPIPLIDADGTLNRVRRAARLVAWDANNLCHAMKALGDLPDWPTEAEAEVENAITRLELALSAAEEVASKMKAKAITRKTLRAIQEIFSIAE